VRLDRRAESRVLASLAVMAAVLVLIYAGGALWSAWLAVFG